MMGKNPPRAKKRTANLSTDLQASGGNAAAAARPSQVEGDSGAPPPEAPQAIPWFSDWQVRLYAWLQRQVGHRFAVAIIILGVVVAPFLWSNRNEIGQWAWAKDAINFIKKPELPRATAGEYTVLVATLDQDADGRHEDYIMESLRELSSVRAMRLNRRIKIPDPEDLKNVTEDIQYGTPQAQAYLKKTGAHILIWGKVVPGTRSENVPRLFWTVPEGMAPVHAFGRYEAGPSNELPPLFWRHLSEVLQLLVASEATKFEALRGHYTAHMLEPFIAKVRQLLDDDGRPSQWTPEAAAATRLHLANALTIFGAQRGDNSALMQAVTHFRVVLTMYTRARAPLDWARTQHQLGNALALLGERERDTARLEEALTAYREALTERTRERVPLSWAETQSRVGNVLQRLGERERSVVRLEAAVSAYRQALEEQVHASVLLNWATTQNNLGAALNRLGERENNTVRLEEAAGAFREALKVSTRERAPLEWAETQMNLGNALSMHGDRESGTARLKEAVMAYREALKENAPAPLLWAGTQNNLGNALRRIGERDRDTARLEEAVAAYREALTERRRERVPLDWATTQHNLGNALLNLGELKRDTVSLEASIAAYRLALKERTRERVPLQWAITQGKLGDALQELGKVGGDAARLEEAVVAYREAMKERTRERVPWGWAANQNNLGNALTALGELQGSRARLQEAVTAYTRALSVASEGTDGALLEAVTKNLERVRFSLSQQD